MNIQVKLIQTLCFLTLSLIVSCSSPNSEKKSELPADVSYTIISKNPNNALSKTTINVRLNKEVSKDILKKIAYEIKEDNSKHSKLWIFYFLPEMSTGSGAWAISHFKPTLELEIIGASKAATEEMKNKKVTSEILATWIDNDPITPNTVYLVKENEKLLMKSVYAKTNYANATELIDELTKTTQGGLTRYNYQNNHGEFYIIEQNGNLSLYNSDGKFKELKKQ
jgi:hypothetical protein